MEDRSPNTPPTSKTTRLRGVSSLKKRLVAVATKRYHYTITVSRLQIGFGVVVLAACIITALNGSDFGTKAQGSNLETTRAASTETTCGYFNHTCDDTPVAAGKRYTPAATTTKKTGNSLSPTSATPRPSPNPTHLPANTASTFPPINQAPATTAPTTPVTPTSESSKGGPTESSTLTATCDSYGNLAVPASQAYQHICFLGDARIRIEVSPSTHELKIIDESPYFNGVLTVEGDQASFQSTTSEQALSPLPIEQPHGTTSLECMLNNLVVGRQNVRGTRVACSGSLNPGLPAITIVRMTDYDNKFHQLDTTVTGYGFGKFEYDDTNPPMYGGGKSVVQSSTGEVYS